MAPPPGLLNLDVEAISGICGSISIACWVVVFSPQIIENFRRSSADGLSLQFVIVWLLGDVFNILGAVMQGVLPTMIILAIYYTIADIVLLAQCFYYRGFTWKDEVVPPSATAAATQRKAAKYGANGHDHSNGNGDEHRANEYTGLLAGDGAGPNHTADRPRRGSDWSDRLIHVNPVMPLLDPATTPPPPSTVVQAVLWNTVAVVMVIAAGIVGWLLSRNYAPGNSGDSDGQQPSPPHHDPNDADTDLHFDFWGQIFGWLCAVLYLGSRLPQLLLNYRRKSTEGVSMLFFLFACLGNLTYVLSIFAFDPRCWDNSNKHHKGGVGVGNCAPGEAGRVYWRYILVNLSWLAGSLGTLFLDMGIFAQFFIYNRDASDVSDDEEDGMAAARRRAIGEGNDSDDETSIDGDRWEQRPVLERNQSEWSN
ncbi:PQ-loop repeat-containing protein 2 [Coniella lustricola]|uniref:PQ-loop repeat-containing protein 2 n=1 Tax=Coniella lustricola TaxID=2025994 RepID=A0A2T3AF47_9PEZI|nr:PQ-loop repeat-containing protein 2 [Coniella lustricola]